MCPTQRIRPRCWDTPSACRWLPAEKSGSSSVRCSVCHLVSSAGARSACISALSSALLVMANSGMYLFTTRLPKDLLRCEGTSYTPRGDKAQARSPETGDTQRCCDKLFASQKTRALSQQVEAASRRGPEEWCVLPTPALRCPTPQTFCGSDKSIRCISWQSSRKIPMSSPQKGRATAGGGTSAP